MREREQEIKKKKTLKNNKILLNGTGYRLPKLCEPTTLGRETNRNIWTYIEGINLS
jgi:hypothetical protein